MCAVSECRALRVGQQPPGGAVHQLGPQRPQRRRGGELLPEGAGPGAAVGGLAGLRLRPGPGQHRHGPGHGGDTSAVRDADTRNSVMQDVDCRYCILYPPCHELH